MQEIMFAVSTSGSVDWQTEFSGYRFSRTNHARGLVLEKHSHDLASINFVLEGRYVEKCTSTGGVFEKSELLFKPPGETHSNNFGSSHASCLLIEFTSGRYADLEPHLPWLRRNFHATSPDATACAKRLLANLLSGCKSARIAAESSLLELLLTVDREIGRPERQIPRWLEDVEEYIRQHKYEIDSLDDVARHAGVHVAHLSRQFRRYYARTVGEFIRNLKIDDAMYLLETTEMPIAEVAERCGFSDQSHLGRNMKIRHGVTPRQYRNSNR